MTQAFEIPWETRQRAGDASLPDRILTISRTRSSRSPLPTGPTHPLDR